MNLVSYFRVKEYQLRSARVKFIQKQIIQKKPADQKEDTLHVVYLLAHVSVCGGVKIILEHANELINHGVQVSLLSHYPKPSWFDIKANYIQIPFGIEMARGIPPNCDLIVATYWDHLGTCVESCIAPVVYFEQGDFHLWDWDNVSLDRKEIISKLYQLPSHVITCSETGATKIKEVFNWEASVFHNALNNQVFFAKEQAPTEHIVLGVGRDITPFKRIPDIWDACQIVRDRGHNINFTWVTPQPPKNPLGTLKINPTQEELGNIYRQAWVYVCASEYETFPLPPLEAMACGTPVITTPNDGVLSYGRDGENCLTFQPGNTQELADKITSLLENPGLYKKLQENGYKTAARYSWEQIIPKLKAYYEQVSGYQPVGINTEKDWVKLVPMDFSREEELALEQLLSGTAADIVSMPFAYNFNDEISIIRWQPVFQRVLAMSGQVDCLYCSFKERSLEDYLYKEAVHELLGQKYGEAIKKFKSYLDQTNNPQEAAVLLRWVAWCLIKSEHYSEAKKLLEKGLKSYPSYIDLYNLYGLLCQQLGHHQQSENIKDTIRTLGDAVEFPEYIRTKELITE